MLKAVAKRRGRQVSVLLTRSVADLTSEAKPEPDVVHGKPFEDIPGPRGPLGLGSIANYFRYVGSYDWIHLDKCGESKYLEYGSIVRETMIPGVNVVWLFDPSDIAKVLNESGPGVYPSRTSHLALQKYRKDRPHVYRSGGLLPTNGAEWWRMRSEFQKGLSSPQHVRNRLKDTEQITREFLQQFLDPGSPGVVDVLPELSRLNLELVSHLAFDVRLNGFSPEEKLPTSTTSRLIESAETTNNCILPTDQGIQLWRYFDTPVYRKLKKAQQFMESVAVDLVSQKISFYNEDASSDKDYKRPARSRSILEEYLGNPKLDLPDIVGIASDFLLAGIDTTSYTTSFLLYHIARNPEVQAKLYLESCRLLPDGITGSYMAEEQLNSGATYARAVLKECLRMNPISVGVGRNLNNDMILGGYRVPKGTVTVTQNMVACRLPQNFVNPDRFIPERWMRGDAQRVSVNPFLVLPFGHGMRACIARRLAEQSMLVLVISLIREFEIRWCGTEHMGVHTRLINKPDQPVLIRFNKRT